MLQPKQVKYRKQHKMRNPGIAHKGCKVSFGEYGLKATSSGRLTSRQIEAARRVITHEMKRGGKVWVRLFPDRPYTKKAAEVGMGSGKGDVAGYVMDVRPGRVMFEIDGATEGVAREALRKAGTKLPVKVRIVERQ